MNDRRRNDWGSTGRFDTEEIAAPIRPDATDSRDRWSPTAATPTDPLAYSKALRKRAT